MRLKTHKVRKFCKKSGIFAAIFALIVGQFAWSLKVSAEENEPENLVTSECKVSVSGTKLEYNWSGHASDFEFKINGSADSDYVVLQSDEVIFEYDEEKNIIGFSMETPVECKYEYESGTVTFGIRTQWDDYLTSIKINGVDYSSALPKTKAELIDAFKKDGRAIFYDIAGVPYSETYDIVVTGRKQTDDEKIIGNFFWTYEEIGDEDDQIPHGTLEFVSAKYDGETYTDINSVNDAGENYEWQDTMKNPSADYDGSYFGEAMFPVGTELTVKLIPDSGYQLTEFTVNGSTFEASEDESSQYTFEVAPGNFHLGAHFTEVENEVVSETDEIISGSIDSEFDHGTAKLEISDVNPETSADFENALDEGYEISDYYNISLYNTIYKGGKTEGGELLSWDEQVDDPENDANITFELTEDMSGKDIVIIHEEHTGETVDGYEELEVVYNEDTNTIIFSTPSFSNFAVAVADKTNSEKHTVTYETNGGTEISARKVTDGNAFSAPTAPTKAGYVFEGWYSDAKLAEEYNFNSAVKSDLTLYAKWSPLTKYSVSDGYGNKISFYSEDGHEYDFVITDFANLPDDVIDDVALMLDVTREEFLDLIEKTKEAVKDYGDVLAIYGIGLADETFTEIHEGPFNIELAMTEAMEGYTFYKLTYIDYDNDLATESPISLTAKDGYLNGTLKHLSYYVLTGSNAPKAPNSGIVE